MLDAMDLMAGEGWRLLPHYTFDAASGLWRHRAGLPEPPASLRDIAYDGTGMHYPSHRHHEPESRLAEYLAEARELLARPPAPLADGGPSTAGVGPDFETLRWFLLPEEVASHA